MKKYVVVGLVVLAVIVAGCSGKSKTENTKNTEPVAKVDGQKITVEDFTNFIKSKPMQQAGKTSKEVIEKYLDDMVTEEVLYREALRLKIDQDPQVKSTFRRILSQKLMEEQVRNKLWKNDIDEQRLQQYYDKNRDEFNRPEQVRLADIYIAVPPDANEGKKAELKKKAETVLAEAKKEVPLRNGLMPLIQQYSDAPSKYPKGNTGFFDIEGNPVGIDKNLAQEAFKIEKAGDLLDHMVEASDGFHIIMLVGKRPAINKSLAEVSDLLKQRIRQEEFPKLSKEYIDGLKKNAKIQTDQQKVEEVMKSVEGLQGNRPQLPPAGAPPTAPPGDGSVSVRPPVKMMPVPMPQEAPGPGRPPENAPPVKSASPN